MRVSIIVPSYIIFIKSFKAHPLLDILPMTSQNVGTELEEPGARSLCIITFSDEYIICMCKVVDCIMCHRHFMLLGLPGCD